jgi:ADP-ribosylglycohydrolase
MGETEATSMRDTVLYDRIYGCLVGALIGDSMGEPTEGWDYRRIEAEFGNPVEPAAYTERLRKGGTDDSALKHLLIEAIARGGGHVTPHDWASVWLEKMRPHEFYTPVANAYHKVRYMGVSPREAGRGNMLANSSAMCISPIGIINAGNPRQAVLETLNAACLIHDGAPLQGACAAAAAVAAALDPRAGVADVIGAAGRYLDPDTDMRTELARIVGLAQSAGDYAAFREAYYANPRPFLVDPRESLSVALACFALAQGDATRTVIHCANFGRDCDTIATMGGAVAGAFAGARAFPHEWIERVQAVTPVDQAALADQLLAVLQARRDSAEAWTAALRTMETAR